MRLRVWLTFALIILTPSSLWAVIGTPDVTPAATLLFPYFEVDLSNVNGRTTIITIQAATPTATLAHVTLWTDLGIPIYAFDVYLTGYDMQAINIRDLFDGLLPHTADDGQDPMDTGNPYDGISNQGQWSQDINYPGSTGPCGTTGEYLIPAETLADLRAAHTGQAMPSSGLYAGRNLFDNVARGFITVDVATQCSPFLPSDIIYFAGGIVHNGNWLLGEYLLVNLAENFMKSETAVHIEADESLLGERTFYGRLASATGGIDRREPLPSSWALGALTDSVGSPDNQIMVWRDPGVNVAPFANPAALPAPFPMAAASATAFDDESRVTSLATTLAPYATTSTRLVPDLFNPGTKLGWASLDLNVGPNPADVRQSWVTVAHTWEGRFSTATNGVMTGFVPRLQFVSASCVGGTAQVNEAAGPEPFVFFQNCTAPRQISFRLRLIDSAARSVTGQLGFGTWAGPPAETTKTTVITPGEFNTVDLWGATDTGNGTLVQFFVPGGPLTLKLRLRVF